MRSIAERGIIPTTINYRNENSQLKILYNNRELQNFTKHFKNKITSTRINCSYVFQKELVIPNIYSKESKKQAICKIYRGTLSMQTFPDPHVWITWRRQDVFFGFYCTVQQMVHFFPFLGLYAFKNFTCLALIAPFRFDRTRSIASSNFIPISIKLMHTNAGALEKGMGIKNMTHLPNPATQWTPTAFPSSLKALVQTVNHFEMIVSLGQPPSSKGSSSTGIPDFIMGSTE